MWSELILTEKEQFVVASAMMKAIGPGAAVSVIRSKTFRHPFHPGPNTFDLEVYSQWVSFSFVCPVLAFLPLPLTMPDDRDPFPGHHRSTKRLCLNNPKAYVYDLKNIALSFNGHSRRYGTYNFLCHTDGMYKYGPESWNETRFVGLKHYITVNELSEEQLLPAFAQWWESVKAGDNEWTS